MKIENLHIVNYKSLKDITISDIEMALILVGRNNTGKSSVLDAVKLALSRENPKSYEYGDYGDVIRVGITMRISDQDFEQMFSYGMVSSERDYDAWYSDFCGKLGCENRCVNFEYVARRDAREAEYLIGGARNDAIREILPRVISVGTDRDPRALEQDLLWLQADESLRLLEAGRCVLDPSRQCRGDFACIPAICAKKPEDLNVLEISRLLDYKLAQNNINGFAGTVNDNYHRNGGQDDILYGMRQDASQMLRLTSEVRDSHTGERRSTGFMGNGMKSIYLFSLLETYAAMNEKIPAIFLLDEPETFLHPKLQKTVGNILCRLSRKNQVIFTTHAPNLLPNFNNREIRQMILDDHGDSEMQEETDVNGILDDLGYTAGDILNVDFVFIVEGKEDKSRLPLILKKYFPDTVDENGELSRIAILTTNSCTNIETYANLKYMNQVYLGDSFLMIRDGDGKNASDLKRQLCGYYESQRHVDGNGMPRVTEDNVLILRYYSLENYFMNPKVMAKIGVIRSEDEFYRIFLKNWRESWNHCTSGIHLRQVLGRNLKRPEDVKAHLELIRKYLRGHNLFDVYYARYRGNRENEILQKYIDAAPRSEFADILDAVEHFLYFQNREAGGSKKE
ncbi:MAG: ATP-dependent nuclease [Lachnospiraceae bacterium]|jgi:putative ATP-dependent endonuclease of OLD family